MQASKPFFDAGAGHHQVLSLAEAVKLVGRLPHLGDDSDCPKGLTPIAEGNDEPLSRVRIHDVEFPLFAELPKGGGLFHDVLISGKAAMIIWVSRLTVMTWPTRRRMYRSWLERLERW